MTTCDETSCASCHHYTKRCDGAHIEHVCESPSMEDNIRLRHHNDDDYSVTAEFMPPPDFYCSFYERRA
jgi:hypothetical protein